MCENLGVLFALIYLPLARTPEAGFLHKQTCLNLFRRAFEGRGTGRITLELFINYDCNRKMPNLVELCVRSACDVVTNSHASPGWISTREEGALHSMGLDILLSLFTSMLKWASNVGRSDYGVIDYTVFMEEKALKNHMEYGSQRFNQAPDDGFDYLIDHGVLLKEVNSIVDFFLQNPMNCLHEEKIGEWLGRQDDLNKVCCKELFNKLAGGFPHGEDNFRNKTLDMALRHILPIVRFPQDDPLKAERVALAFAQVYCRENPRDIPVEHV
jgi:Sec7-like guanine-nucleotide exchange factor